MVLAMFLFGLAGVQTPPPKPLQQRDLAVERPAPAETLKKTVTVPRGYAVVIGISDYKNLDAANDLRFAEKDAESIYSVLISKEGGNIEFENIRKLIGPQATLANIRKTLEEWLPGVAKEDDRVIVYFVGHGLVDRQGRGYLAPYDVDPSRPDATGYGMDKLGQVLSQQVKARWKVLLTDACHSGKVTTDSTALKINEKIENLPRGFLTLTSSRESELSYEDPALAGGAGVFTYFLVQGWQGQADTGPADGIVTADELIDYVRNEVRQYVRKQQARQTPSERGDFPNDLILGYSPKRRQQLAGSAAPVAAGVIVVEVNQENTEIYIDEQRTGVASPGKPLQVPGLSSGVHQIRAVRMGFEPATVEVNVVPGSTQTVSLRLLYPRKTKPSAQAAYEEAERIWLRSKSSPADLQRAADLYAKALKEDSSHSPSALGLCRILQQQGKTEEALKSCRRAVQLDPDYVEARTMTGVLALETGDAQEAVRQLQTASRQDARNATVQANFAEALYAADRAAEAEAAATAALQIDSALAYAYLIRAEARRAQKNFAGAADDYQRSIALEQFDSGVMRTIGFWAIGTGMTKNRSGYRALYRARRSDAYLGLCACETARDNLLRAASYCDKALALAPDDADAYVLLGQVYAGLFNRDNRKEDLLRAQSSLQKALQVNPALPQAPEIKRQLAEIREYLPRVR